jgi:Holliday junction resolvase RusA-like endonuclease
MNRLSFTVPGEPRGKGAGRASTVNGHAMVFMDKQTRIYQNMVGLAAQDALAGRRPFDIPIRLDVVVRVTPPASVSNRKRAAMLAGEIRPGKKPDLSNYIKAVEDGCNKIAFADDALIVSIRAEKRYAEIAGMDVAITTVGAVLS